jgi:hypothetical protein
MIEIQLEWCKEMNVKNTLPNYLQISAFKQLQHIGW